MALIGKAILQLSGKHFLYRAGDNSGWTALGWKANSGWTAKPPTITYEDTYMNLHAGSYHSGIAYYSLKVDLTKYKEFGAHGTFLSYQVTGDGLYVFSAVDGSGLYPNKAVAQNQLGVATITDSDVTLDISSLSGEYYVAFGIARTGDGQSDFTMTEVWLK